MVAFGVAQKTQAKRWYVRGRVQGVGYRYFVQRHASALGIRGYARNLDDGRVEVYATGDAGALSELEGLLWKGPTFSDVRGVEGQEAPVERQHSYQTFQIER